MTRQASEGTSKIMALLGVTSSRRRKEEEEGEGTAEGVEGREMEVQGNGWGGQSLEVESH